MRRTASVLSSHSSRSSRLSSSSGRIAIECWARKLFSSSRVEIAVDPGRAQCRRAAGDIARIQQNFGGADPARGAERRIVLQPIGGDRVGFTGQGLFGVFAQRLLVRPIRVLFDEIGDIGKSAGGARAGVIHPAQHLERKRVLDRCGVGVGPVPIAGLGRGQRRAHCRRDRRRKASAPAPPRPAQSPRHKTKAGDLKRARLAPLPCRVKDEAKPLRVFGRMGKRRRAARPRHGETVPAPAMLKPARGEDYRASPRLPSGRKRCSRDRSSR